MNTNALIQLEGLTKIFRASEVETHALSGIDLQINKGEFAAITGPSGCGKSTLLSLLGLLDTPSSGNYFLDGVNVAKFNDDQRSECRNTEIGFIFQSFNLIGDLTVFENVELPLIYRGLSKKECRERAEAALERLDMIGRRDHYPKQLSGGQQQRAAVARALAGNPKILLADEPTGNLDSKNGEMVMELLEKLHSEGATICMVTHNERHAEIADRVVRLTDGKLSDYVSSEYMVTA